MEKVPRRLADAFLVLVAVQAAHSVEETAFRLFDAFAPARLVGSLFSDDPQRGFVFGNALVVGAGFLCWALSVRQSGRNARAIAWFWTGLEIVNGCVHLLMAAATGTYFPGSATAPLLLVAAGYLGLVLRCGDRTARAPSAVFPVLFGMSYAIYVLGFHPAPPAKAGALRIVAANLNTRNGAADEAIGALASLHPDVLVLLEWSPANRRPERLLRAGYRLALDDPRDGTHGSAVLFSRGIRATAALAPSPASGACALPLTTVRLQGPPGPFGIVGVHAPPPVSNCRGENPRWIEALAADLADGHARVDVGAIRGDDPVVLMGDFNALPHDPKLRALQSAGFLTAPFRSLVRMEPTWGPLWFGPHLARIDHVFVSRRLTMESSWSAAVPGSDHRAVGVDVLAGGVQ